MVAGDTVTLQVTGDDFDAGDKVFVDRLGAPFTSQIARRHFLRLESTNIYHQRNLPPGDHLRAYFQPTLFGRF